MNISYSFTAGTKIKAAEINENFTACKDAIDTNTSDISANTVSINAVEATASLNAIKIGTLANLTTTEKTNLVGAVNEVNAKAPKQREKLPTLGNNVSDANNDIDITAGYSYDSIDAVLITNSALTKRLDASWSAGTNQGGLDTGSKTNSTWYHVFVISKADGTTDALFSTSATAPTMPSGYTYKRRIGSVKTDGSGNILGFIQIGNIVQYKTVITDYTSTSTTASYTDLILSAPLNTRAILRTLADGENNTNAYATLFLKNKVTGQDYEMVAVPFGGGRTPYFEIDVDSLSKIQYKSTLLGGTCQFVIYTTGYIDTRGQQ